MHNGGLGRYLSSTGPSLGRYLSCTVDAFGSRALANSPMRPGETSPQAVTSCSLAAIGAVRAACCAFFEQLTRCNEVWQQHHRASGFSRDHRWKLRGWMSFDREVRRTRGWIRALC